MIRPIRKSAGDANAYGSHCLRLMANAGIRMVWSEEIMPRVACQGTANRGRIARREGKRPCRAVPSSTPVTSSPSTGVATAEDVQRVWVAGRLVVDGGCVL